MKITPNRPYRCDPRLRNAILTALLAVSCAHAQTDTSPPTDETSSKAASAARTLDKVQVIGRRQRLVGEVISASEGSVGQQEISARPLLRSGDLLEFVPGLVATQHSGSGKANQYFLRGFNLDHGTDFATFVDAMPVNMRTHGHGQGWTDLNFLIPETVEELRYRKGPYFEDVGDFSSAGSARFEIQNSRPSGELDVTAGDYGYARGVLVNSTPLGSGDLLVGLELQTFDGPWRDIDEDVEKANLLLRYSQPAAAGRAHVMLMAYDNSWNSADQIPERAVEQGLISEFGSLDTSVGGKASRYSLSGGWEGSLLGGEFSAQAYAIQSDLDLFSNFTYLLDDPLNGDQFQQLDERRLYGFEVKHEWERGRSRWRIGLDGRFDDISRVALNRTDARELVSVVREDAVDEGSLGIHLAHEYRFSDTLRSHLAARYDRYRFEVDARTLAQNSGTARDSTPSFKASLIYRPSDPLELYLSSGQGFHSNDARGTTIQIDPLSGDPADPVDPLVDSIGGELGARLHVSDQLQATLAAWSLRLDSELLFVGDAGNTEAGRPSRRDGLELGVYWFGTQSLSANLEVSYTDSEFRDQQPEGQSIPGSIPLVISAGVSKNFASGWLGSAQLRHFGPYPLIEDDSVESDGSTALNLRIGRQWAKVGVFVDVLNVLNSRDHDIDYFYASRLQGEPLGGIEDLHYHVFQPRSIRLSVRIPLM